MPTHNQCTYTVYSANSDKLENIVEIENVQKRSRWNQFYKWRRWFKNSHKVDPKSKHYVSRFLAIKNHIVHSLVNFIAFSVSRKRQEKRSFIVLFIVVITFLVCNSTRVVDNIYFTIYPYSREHVHFCQQQDK